MSVDYYSCECCGEALYEEYVGHCAKCEKNLCTDCLVNNEDIESDGNYVSPYCIYSITEEQKQNLIEKYGEKEVDRWINWGGINPEYCPYCSGEVVDDYDLLNFVIIKFGLDKEKLKTEYLNSK